MAIVDRNKAFRVEGNDTQVFYRGSTSLKPLNLGGGAVNSDYYTNGEIPVLSAADVDAMFRQMMDESYERYDSDYRNETGVGTAFVAKADVADYLGREPIGSLPLYNRETENPAPGTPDTKMVNGVRVDIKTGQPYVDPQAQIPLASSGTVPGSVSSPAQTFASSPSIPTGNLQPGMSGPEVLKLQNYLVSQGLMTQADMNTGPGIYGPKTTAAVKALQERLGVDNSSGVGYYGPRTISAVQGSVSQNGGYGGSGGISSPGSIPGQGGGASPYTPGAAGTGAAFASTGVPQLDALLGTLKTYLDGIVAAGNKINPNIEIDPKMAAQFLKQAESEINPYYKSTINAIRDDVGKNLANLQKQYDLTKKDTEAQLKDTLATSREQAAGAGTIFSGQRGAGERDLSSLYNRKFEEQALGLESSIGGTLRDTERTIGSRNISDLIPSFSSASASTEGKGSVIGGRSLSFQPTGGVTGSLERENITAVQSRVNELEESERARRSLNFYNT